MKKFLILMSILITCSCDRKPLYLSESAIVNIYINISTNIDDLWGENWRNEVIYNWDESYLGPIGYSETNDSLTIILINNGIEYNRFFAKKNEKTPIMINTDTRYDVIIYNKIESVIENNFNLETNQINGFENGEIGSKYKSYNEPGEIFSSNINGFYVSSTYNEYDLQVINGVPVYIININSELKPFSYLYLVQFVILNDDDTSIEAKNISNFTITNINTKKNLVTNKAINDGMSQLITNNIKPGQYVNGSLVFASKISTFGVYDNENSSWNDNNNLYYTILTISTYSYGDVTGVIDITNQIKNKPRGGVITVYVKNSDIKKGGSTSTGFGVSLSEWEELIQNIPF